MKDQFLINIDPYLLDFVNFYEAVILGIFIGLLVSMLFLWIFGGTDIKHETGN